ncbi:MAG: hypothetical protein COA52_01025 [Hyphomicrobiales bacterium]|nr:MAG: hypothetical protein COA52_01025 [Hyphomicrobiales bacterium]
MPYTYLIGWSKYKKFYYGVRYSKYSNPEDLWVTYFTSSEYVTQFRKKYGEPDIIQIRKVFDCANKAKKWENRVLRKMKVYISEKWLNKTCSYSFPIRDITGDNNPMKNEDIKEKAIKTKKDRESKMTIDQLRKRYGRNGEKSYFIWECETCNKKIKKWGTVKAKAKRFCNKSCAAKTMNKRRKGIKLQRHDIRKTICITNGVETKRILESALIPKNWKKGRHWKPRKNT